MAKSGRHKKLRKQEKAKTQLKGKKILGKAQNVVEPKLRAKKILLREQLKGPSTSIASLATTRHDSDDDIESLEVTTEATTRKKQSIQDVLTSLNHHNKNIKKDALNGLIEIITSQSALLFANLDRILVKLGALTSDVEGIVRKENIRVSEIIFAQLKEEQVNPFWNLLLTHVKCTLTNLNPSIRYDCLSFLTLLINYFPNLAASSNHIILPNLLGQISTSGSSTPTPLQQASTSKKSKPSPASSKSTLKVEISSHHNDSYVRLRVLSLIASCLELEKKKSDDEASTFGSSLELEWDSYNVNNNCLYSPYGYQEFQTTGKRSTFSLNGLSSNATSEEDSSRFLPNFVRSCMSILWETSLEFKPSLKNESVDKSKVINLGGNRDKSSLTSVPIDCTDYLQCIEAIKSVLNQLQRATGIASS